MENNLILRLANEKDEILLLDWINDFTVRKWSFINPQTIDPNVHKRWFKKKLKDKNVRIWIMEKQNRPCGQIRFERSNNQIVLHYLIASEFRGQNLGSKMIMMAVNKTCDEWFGKKIFAYTVPKNVASIKSLEKAGFTEESYDSKKKCFIYECN